MDSNIVSLDAHRPHITLEERDANGRAIIIHVIPMLKIRDWAEGRAPLPDEGLLRAALADWLWFLETERMQGPAA
ncbi:MAG: hypothetical protein AB7Q01_14155 [Gammaproteobacteria bacterium]